MELEVIKALVSEFKAAELTKLSLKCEAFELTLEKEKEVVQAVSQFAPAPAAISYAAPAAVSESVSAAAQKETAEAVKHITSPMVGTFYASRTPGGKPFAEVGTKVKKGDVVCIIEAMKLMNEVEAEVDGEIVEVLVKNEQMVEYAEPLFVIK